MKGINIRNLNNYSQHRCPWAAISLHFHNVSLIYLGNIYFPNSQITYIVGAIFVCVYDCLWLVKENDLESTVS